MAFEKSETIHEFICKQILASYVLLLNKGDIRSSDDHEENVSYKY